MLYMLLNMLESFFEINGTIKNMKSFLPRCTKGSRQARKYDLVETLEQAMTAGDLVCFWRAKWEVFS